MDELNNNVKAEILRMKIAQAQQQYYGHQVDAQVARDIGGMEGIVKAAQENMARAKKLIDGYMALLEDVDNAEKS
jgi:hypothetical protein